MKILLVNKFLYPKGGDAISTLSTGELLSSRGHKVIFWGMCSASDPDYAYKNCFVSYVDFNNPGGIKNRVKMALNLLYSLEAKEKIERVILFEKPDIVHLNNFAHQISPSILHILKKYDVPAVMTMRDYKLVCPAYSMLLDGIPCERCKGGRYYHCLLNKCSKDSFSKSLLNTIEMYLHHSVLNIYGFISTFIAPSLFLKEKVEEMGFNEKIVHLPNFIDLDDYQPLYSFKDRSIIYFGRLSREKGLFTLLDAIKGAPGVMLKVVGEGPLKNDLISVAKKENISNVIFPGYKTGEELREEIRRTVGAVLPSECYENNPRSVIEAFALGKPVIGSRIGGIPELVKDGETGLLFEARDSMGLRSRILCLLGNPEGAIQMGRNARVFAERELSAEKHYKSLMDIYNRVAGLKSGSI